MRLSRYFLPILRETPKEAEIVSHRLMLRAGMVRQEAAGIYAFLPLAAGTHKCRRPPGGPSRPAASGGARRSRPPWASHAGSAENIGTVAWVAAFGSEFSIAPAVKSDHARKHKHTKPFKMPFNRFLPVFYSS